MPAAVGLAGVLDAAATRATGDDTADRAQLHRSRRIRAVADLTQIALESTPVDIATSVLEIRGEV